MLNWHNSRYPNLGKQQVSHESVAALEALAALILVPTIEAFGDIEITYGFTSPELLTQIRKLNPTGIAPKLDQHACHEHSKKGEVICSRLGAAVDFIAPRYKTKMHLVADWISQNTAYDRLYFYGPDRPLHVSYGPYNTRAIQIMNISKQGKRVPGKRGVCVPFSSIYPME